MSYIFGIETTGNCGSTNKRANIKKQHSTFKNGDLRKLFKKYQNFGFIKKKNQKLCIVEKNPRNKKS